MIFIMNLPKNSFNALPLHAIGIIGIAGRMGQHLVKALQHRCSWIGGYDNIEPILGTPCLTLQDVFHKSSWVLDFSHASLFPQMVQAALSCPKPLLVGTTGVTHEVMLSLKELSKKVAVVVAPNTSIGAMIQRWMAKKLAQFLPETYDIDIIETHHRHKKDSPSGTSMALAYAVHDVKKNKGIHLDIGGTTFPRENNRIEMHALRCGSIPGTHDIVWTSDKERLMIRHTAFSSEIFVQGSIMLLDWMIQGQNPGIYSVEDVLEFEK